MTTRKMRSQLIACVLIVALLSVLSDLSLAQVLSKTFTETGKTVTGKFLAYWTEYGGLAQQGYPVSDLFQERSKTDGKTYTVQYFERAVFEMHPENRPPYDVLLSLLGTFQYEQKYPEGAPNQTPNTSPGSVVFRETNHRVGGRFLEYWQQNGGLRQQGYPISDQFEEKSDLDGKTYTVQYFERAVFELHPENQRPYDVLLSQLGTFQYRARYPNLPRSNAEIQRVIAENNQLSNPPLAADNMAIYSSPDIGAALLLTPPANNLPITADELAKDPGSFKGQVFGSLVLQPANPLGLPPDDYLITISAAGPDDISIVLVGAQNSTSFPGAIRKWSPPLPPLPRPSALITARQMCIGWGDAQICAVWSLPPGETARQRLLKAIDHLGVSTSTINIDLAVPDIEGQNGLENCAQALNDNPPRYKDCRPNLLAAPVAPQRILPTPTPPQPGPVTSIGLIAALDGITGNIFPDPNLTRRVPLPPNDYLAYGAPSQRDTPIVSAKGTISSTQVLLSGPAGAFYVAAQRGERFIAPTLLRGKSPSGEDEAFIINLGFTGWICLNFFGECKRFN